MPSTIPVRNPGLTVTTTNLLLPAGFPSVPSSVKGRFPEMEQWEKDMLQWWRSMSQALLESNRQNSTSISQNYAAIQEIIRRLGMVIGQDDNGTVITSRTFNAAIQYNVGGVRVLTARQPAIADATGVGDVVAQLNLWLAAARAHGLIDP